MLQRSPEIEDQTAKVNYFLECGFKLGKRLERLIDCEFRHNPCDVN